MLLALLFVGVVVVAGGISVIITGTNLSGVTSVAIGDRAPTAHMPQGKSSAHSRGLVTKKTQATTK